MPSFQYEPCGDGAMRHFGVPSAFTTGIPGFTMSAVKAVYQKICCAIAPCAGTGPDSEKVMPCAWGGAYFFSQSRYFVIEYTAAGPLVSPPRSTEEPTGRQPSMRMPHSSTGLPFGMPLSPLPAIDSHASVKRQPSEGSFLP